MRISISGKNIDITEAMHDLVVRKMGKIERYFPNDTAAQITMSVEHNRHIVEVTIPFVGGVIRGEEVTNDMYASIDNVIDKLERQIRKHRTRLEKTLRNDAFVSTYEDDDIDEHDEEASGRVVKTKRFDMKPMTVDEAILQLELLGHSFYVFTNGETGEINVLYLRKDGNFGLIEPE
ncbi:MAG: ribosome-associated translation inhibitor RaiA [Clostridia bacterium]|nr:ribosome-associated translation inhibitor RaiA [Clostridia bacterium]